MFMRSSWDEEAGRRVGQPSQEAHAIRAERIREKGGEGEMGETRFVIKHVCRATRMLR
jgi:hypothetical protein